MIEQKTVDKFWKRYNRLLNVGINLGLVRGYSEELTERFRNVYYGGIPASIILLNPRGCLRKCYDRSVLACVGLEDLDYQVVHANIDSIRYNKADVALVNYYLARGQKISENYANHCFVEYKSGDTTWVLDTTDGLIYEKRFYYFLNHPEITCIRTKEETMAFPDYIDIAKADIEKDKWAALTILPVIEAQIEESSLYKEMARREIKMFKEKIKFDEISKQYEEEKEAYFEYIKQLRKENKATN